MGSGRSLGGVGIPGGGIGSLAPGLSPGMGGRFPMGGAAAPGGQYGAPMPGGPQMGGQPRTQQEAMQQLMDAQRSAPAQIPPVGMMGGQMAMPAPPGMMPGAQFGAPTQSFINGMGGGQMSSPGSMFGSMTGQQPVAAPGGVPPNTPPAMGMYPTKSSANFAPGRPTGTAQGIGSLFGGALSPFGGGMRGFGSQSQPPSQVQSRAQAFQNAPLMNANRR
jgi:hypothetical protein